MQRILFAFLSVLGGIQKFGRKLRGKTEADEAAERIVSGKAWEDYCDQLKKAGAVLKFPGTPQDPFNQAEGIRYLTRLTRAGLENFVEFNNPEFPVLRRMVHEHVKLGADNPDNYYFNTQINGKNEYRIAGQRNSIHYIGFFTQNGSYGSTGGLAPCGVLQGDDLVVEEDGSFEIILSKERRGPNWLKVEDETSMVMVRQTFLDRRKEVPAEVRIENLNGRNKPEPITPEQVSEGLKMAAMFVAGAPLLFAKWARGFQKHVNQLPQFDPDVSNAAGGDADIIYYHSYWKLGPNEALRIQVTPPDCDTWNFQLNNYWMESLDYRYFTICLNKHSAQYNADGSVTIVVAHRDPGASNWINTCSHFEGTMCWRWYRLAEGTEPVEPRCEVINLKNA